MHEGLPLKFAQVETLLAALLDVNVTRASVLTSRFKQLRRLSFPPGVNTGKAKFEYDLDAILITVVGFALLDALLLPQAMTQLLRTEWPDIRREAARTIGRMSMGEHGVEAARENCLYLVVNPHAHRHWSEPAPTSEPADSELAIPPATLCLMSWQEIENGFGQVSSRPMPSRIIVDLFGHVLWTVQAMTRVSWTTLEEVQASARGLR